MPDWQIFVWGFIGGFGAEAIVIYDISRQKPSALPYWIKSKAYYLIAFVMILLGGTIALAHSKSGGTLTPILSIQIGASTPLMLRKLRDATLEPPSPPDSARID